MNTPKAVVAALLATLVVAATATAVAEPEPEHPSHAARPTAGAPVPAAASGADHPGAQVAWLEGEARAAWFAGVLEGEAREQQAMEAARQHGTGRSGI